MNKQHIIHVRPVKQINILINHIFEVILFKKSLPRIVVDIGLKQVLPQLNGKSIDLGASPKTAMIYKQMNPELDYLVTNIRGDYEQYLDMEHISFEADSSDLI